MHPNLAGELGVVLFVSETRDIFDDGSPEPGLLTLPQIVGATVGEVVHVGVLFHGYTPDQNGLIDIVIRMTVSAPEGRMLIEEREWSHYRDSAPSQPSFIMAKHRLDLAIEPGDPLGEYRISATVRDLVSGSEQGDYYFLEVLGPEYGEP